MMDTEVIEQLQAAFLPEAADLLADLGDALLALEQDPLNSDLVNRVFRAMHTLKGSGATAGFRRLANFVHHVEEVFNRIRNHELTTTPELIDAALKATDCCGLLLKLGSNSDTNVPLEGEVLAAISPYLPELKAVSAKAIETCAPTDELHRYTIDFAPNREIFFSGTDPASLLLELGDLGLVEVRCDTEGLTTSDEFEPEQCYLKWHISIQTKHPESALRAVFQFVEDDCEILISEQKPLHYKDSAASVVTLSDTVKTSSSATGSTAVSTQDVRVDSAKLDALMRLAGELLVARSALPGLASRLEKGDSLEAVAKEIRIEGAKASRLANELQATVMSMRMLPARQVFRRFTRLVRDLGRTLDKEIELHVSGEETQLDKTLIEALGEPLMHIVRNAADHGIESKEERAKAGKSVIGTISLSASTRGSIAVIEVRDDGKGLDPEKLKRRAIEKHLFSEAEVTAMSDDAAYKIIMAAGFSTIDQVTDLSGRGVGMDVVRDSVEALRGSIFIESTMGKGTCFRIELPASLMVTKGILVAVDSQRLVLPMDTIRSMVKLPTSLIRGRQGQRIAHVRGVVIPLVYLAQVLCLDGLYDGGCDLSVVIIDAASGPYGIVVDQFIGEVEIVVRPLSGVLAHMPEYVGAAILGDGATALVINTELLIKLNSHNQRV
jgi:two-component system chemotaxis sensor kinase CheA